MNILIWNCRGVGNKGFSTLLEDLGNRYNAKMFVLLETHISSSKAQRLVRKF